MPSSDNLKELAGKHVNTGQGFNALEDLIKSFFKRNTASWEIQAQLALDEDASK